MSSRLLAPLLSILLACAPIGVRAWGNEGHETVGAMADALIAGSHAEAEVRALLKKKESLSSISVWADCAKGYCGPLTAEMKTFVQANPHHHDYHFTDVPYQLAAYQGSPVGTGDDDVVHILGQCIAVLRDDSSNNPHAFTKRQALLLLTHLVGDIHQPLHVGTAYVDANDEFVAPNNQTEIDDGLIKATIGDNSLVHGSRPLHSYWDTDVVKTSMHRASVTSIDDFAQAMLTKHTAPAAIAGDPSAWPEKWANESLSLAKKVHDTVSVTDEFEVQDRNHTPHVAWHIDWGANYPKTASTEGEKALTKAGYRLAQLLQAIWP